MRVFLSISAYAGGVGAALGESPTGSQHLLARARMYCIYSRAGHVGDPSDKAGQELALAAGGGALLDGDQPQP